MAKSAVSDCILLEEGDDDDDDNDRQLSHSRVLVQKDSTVMLVL